MSAPRAHRSAATARCGPGATPAQPSDEVLAVGCLAAGRSVQCLCCGDAARRCRPGADARGPGAPRSGAVTASDRIGVCRRRRRPPGRRDALQRLPGRSHQATGGRRRFCDQPGSDRRAATGPAAGLDQRRQPAPAAAAAVARPAAVRQRDQQRGWYCPDTAPIRTLVWHRASRRGCSWADRVRLGRAARTLRRPNTCSCLLPTLA